MPKPGESRRIECRSASCLKDHPKAAAYWYFKDTKTPGLYIDGSVRMFSIAEGSNFNSKIEHKQKLE